MIKLVKLLKEIKIEKPISDREIFDFITKSDTSEPHINYLHIFNTYESYKKEFAGDNTPEEDNIFKLYYDRIHKKIFIFAVSEGNKGDIILDKSYKFIKWIGDDEDGVLIILHNIIT